MEIKKKSCSAGRIKKISSSLKVLQPPYQKSNGPPPPPPPKKNLLLRKQTPPANTFSDNSANHFLVGLLPVTFWRKFRATCISSPNKSSCFALRSDYPLVLTCGVLAEMRKTKKNDRQHSYKSKTRAEDGKLQMKALRLQMNPETLEKNNLCDRRNWVCFSKSAL